MSEYTKTFMIYISCSYFNKEQTQNFELNVETPFMCGFHKRKINPHVLYSLGKYNE